MPVCAGLCVSGPEECSTSFLERTLTKSGPVFTRFSRTRSRRFSPEKHAEPGQGKNQEDVLLPPDVSVVCVVWSPVEAS